MENIYLGKITLENHPTLIFTNGQNFLKVSELYSHIKNFSDFLTLSPIEIDNSHPKLTSKLPDNVQFLDLIEDQNVFATGCTYEWSAEKLQNTPDNDVYKRVFLSERSMFFYKGTRKNQAKSQESIGLRPDSNLTIPEAEIVAVFNREKKIIGYTIGNDVTAVDIEKENPLFQMQAKFYRGSFSLAPLIKLGDQLPITDLCCTVIRKNQAIVNLKYNTAQFVNKQQKIVTELCSLGLSNDGAFLFLGCGVSYPKDKGLIPGDEVIIEAEFLPISLNSICAKI